MKAVAQICKISVFLFTFGITSFAHADDCFRDVASLRDHLHGQNQLVNRNPDNWSGEDQNSAHMSLTLDDDDNSLALKIAEGKKLWGQGQVKICPTGDANKYEIKPIQPLEAGKDLDAAHKSVLTDPKTTFTITIKDGDSIEVRIADGFIKRHYGFRAN